jgi:hypothetical protein
MNRLRHGIGHVNRLWHEPERFLRLLNAAGGSARLPPNVHALLLPIGYPMGRFGPGRHVPLADVRL